MLKHILVGVDGSEGSRKALAFAQDLASQAGARLTLLAVLELPTVLPFAPMESYAVLPNEHQNEEYMRRLREELDRAAVPGIPPERIDRRVETGRPAEVLCKQAEALGADLLVVGARGAGTVARLLVGSVSDRVVHHARRPVTVVH